MDRLERCDQARGPCDGSALLVASIERADSVVSAVVNDAKLDATVQRSGFLARVRYGEAESGSAIMSNPGRSRWKCMY